MTRFASTVRDIVRADLGERADFAIGSVRSVFVRPGDMTSPHDALFKAVFSDPNAAAGELRAILPANIAARIDFSTLSLEPGSFVDEELRSRHSDLLFSVKIAGREARLYLLFEHRSTPDPWLAFRLLVYEVHASSPPRSSVLPPPKRKGDRRRSSSLARVDSALAFTLEMTVRQSRRLHLWQRTTRAAAADTRASGSVSTTFERETATRRFDSAR